MAWDKVKPEQKADRARDREVYAGMIDYMDANIGRVMKYLREIGEYENTLIVFMSDNGPSKTAILDYIALGGEAANFFEQFDNSRENRGRPGSSTDIGPGWAFASATPLRLFKGYVTQGGIRVPLIIKPVGGSDTARRVDVLIHVMDLMPTFLELAGVHPPKEWQGIKITSIQGRSIGALIKGDSDSSWAERGMGWESYGMDAFRLGDWKIIRMPEPYGNGIWQLYNLGEDPGETNDLTDKNHKRVAQMAAAWERYAKSNEVVHPDRPVAYSIPVSPGKY